MFGIRVDGKEPNVLPLNSTLSHAVEAFGQACIVNPEADVIVLMEIGVKHSQYTITKNLGIFRRTGVEVDSDNGR